MAIQAQHPSNLIEYSSPPLPGTIGLFGHQFNSFAANGNLKKRLRDGLGRPVSTAYTFGETFPAVIINNDGNQNQLPGYRQMGGGFPVPSEYNTTQIVNRRHPENLLMEDFACNVKRQRDEVEQFLLAQRDELSRALAEKRERHLRELLDAAEFCLNRRLREKDAEMEKAARRNVELEAHAAQLSAEAQIWEAKALAQEAAAASLQAQLQQAVQCSGGKEEGGRAEVHAEDAESAYVDPERASTAGLAGNATVRNVLPGCKACRRRVAQVVILPCSHLCLCSDCGLTAQSCPVCQELRHSVVEVMLC